MATFFRDCLLLFNSFAFLLGFLPAAILACALVDNRPGLRVHTLIILWSFYGYWDIRFVPLLAGSILINWLAVNYFIISKRRIITTVAIVGNIGVLGFFKQWDFFVDNINAVVGAHVSRLDVELPARLSRHTPFNLLLAAGAATAVLFRDKGEDQHEASWGNHVMPSTGAMWMPSRLILATPPASHVRTAAVSAYGVAIVSTERVAESTPYQRAEALQRIAAVKAKPIAPGLTTSILRPSVGLWPHPGKPDGASEFFLITGAGSSFRTTIREA